MKAAESVGRVSSNSRRDGRGKAHVFISKLSANKVALHTLIVYLSACRMQRMRSCDRSDLSRGRPMRNHLQLNMSCLGVVSSLLPLLFDEALLRARELWSELLGNLFLLRQLARRIGMRR